MAEHDDVTPTNPIPRPSPGPKPPANEPITDPALEHTPPYAVATSLYVREKLAQAGMSPRWVPKKHTPLWAALAISVAGSAVPVLTMPNPSWNVIVASVLSGVSLGLTLFFGMKSAGPKR